LAVHIRAENLSLFPKLLNAPRELFSEGCGLPSFEKVKTTIESLRADHNFFMDELSRAVKTMRTVSTKSGSPQDVARQLDTIRERVVALSERSIAHNVLEEGYVYTWPGLIFSATDVERLATEMKHELENMPQRFAGSS
jgi:phage shock protein A